jgi:hypothetical protein
LGLGFGFQQIAEAGGVAILGRLETNTHDQSAITKELRA